MAGLINVVVRFEYHYIHKTSDQDGPTYSCPYGSREEFLKKFGMKDLGHSKASFHLAEQVIEVPLKGELPPVGAVERNVSFDSNVTCVVDERYSPVCMTEQVGNNSPKKYFLLWIDARGEWICIQREFNYMWDAGPFNERMTGPFSISKPLEKKVLEFLNQNKAE